MSEPATKRVKHVPPLDPALEHGLGMGSVIEVLWDLSSEVEEDDESDHTGSTTTRWWQCSLARTDGTYTIETEDDDATDAGCGGGGVTEDEVQVYILQYTADATVGWGDEEPALRDDLQNRTHFLDEHMLFDVEFGGVLYWRKLGDMWEPPLSGGEEADGDGAHTSREAAVEPAEPAKGGGGEGSGGGRAPTALAAAEALVSQMIAELAGGHGAFLAKMDSVTTLRVAEMLVSAKEAAVGLVAEWLAEDTHGNGSNGSSSSGGKRVLTVDGCLERFQLHQRQQQVESEA
jgi:hypothetical protein